MELAAALGEWKPLIWGSASINYKAMDCCYNCCCYRGEAEVGRGALQVVRPEPQAAECAGRVQALGTARVCSCPQPYTS